MKYVVYEVRCEVNGKTYVGKHQTTNINDGYLGSGKLLTRAIKKYGRDKFVKKILHVFDTEDVMNAKEAEIVTEEFCARDDNYNLCPGGHGGWGYVNQNGLNSIAFKGKHHSEETKEKMRRSHNPKSHPRGPRGPYKKKNISLV